jgi:Fe-S-cluster containining protein
MPSGNTLAEPEKWCIFLQRAVDGLYFCLLHRAKPDQCRSFPAQWVNQDSLTTCVGLRSLITTLRRRKVP